MRRKTSALLFVLLLSVGLAAMATPVSADEPELFPVSQAEGVWPNQDGENVYHDVAPHPDEDVNETLVVPRGFNEMVVYHEHTFDALNLGIPHQFRAGDWYPSGEYALIGGGRAIRDETAVFRYEDSDMSPVDIREGNDIMDLEINDDGEVLAVSFTTAEGGQPVSNTVVYSEDGEEFEEIETPEPFEIRALDWSPDGDEAVIVGRAGTVYVYEDGEIRDESIDATPYLRGVSWTDDGVYLVGAEGANRLGLPAGNGTVHEWDGEEAELVTETDDVINSIAWKPDGEYALLAGGFHDGGALYRYEDGDADRTEIDADRLFAADWLDDGNALIVGDEEIWRYSYTVSPDDLPVTASFTAMPKEPTTEDTVELLGFGSTSGGSADRIERWKFDYGQENPDWSTSRYVEVRFPSPGEYDISLQVEDDEGERSEPVNRTVTVTEPPGFDETGDTDDTDTDDDTDESPLPGFGVAVALVALLTAFGLRHRHHET